MHAIIHALNIGTLTAWLSAVGLGVVAWLVPLDRLRHPGEAEHSMVWAMPVVTLGNETAPAGEPDAPSPATNTRAETLPEPPPMAEPAATPPLPEVPDLPPAPIAQAPSQSLPESAATRPANRTPRPADGRVSATTRRGSGADRGERGNGTPGGGGRGMSQTARLAAGRMPPPEYPAEARRRDQQGTVTVAFTVDTEGRVISARVADASRWPLLNEAAVRAVRRWQFPAGPVMNLQRPIVFQLR